MQKQPLIPTAASETVFANASRGEVVVTHPRIRDLPAHEQAAFSKALNGQTRPAVEGVPKEEQDFFYQSDYDDWKAGRPAAD